MPCGSISHWLLFRTTTMIDPQVFPFVTCKAPQTWGAAYGGGFTYANQDDIYNRPFKREELAEENKKRSWGLRFLIEFELFWFYNCGGDSEEKCAGKGWDNPLKAVCG